jgi:hypothetical protein
MFESVKFLIVDHYMVVSVEWKSDTVDDLWARWFCFELI